MKIISILFIVLSFSCVSQKGRKVKEELKVVNACEKHLLLRSVSSKDSVINETELRKVTSSFFTEYIIKTKKYLDKVYDGALFYKYKVKGFIQNDSIYGCELEVEEIKKLIWLDVSKNKGEYVVIGESGYIIEEKDIEFVDSLLLNSDYILKERELIKSTVKVFFDGVNELSRKGYSEKMRKVSSENFYEYFKIKSSLDSIKGYRKDNYTFKEFDYASFYEDSAECRVMFGGSRGVTMNLIKKNGNWMVVGENGSVVTKERVDRVRNDKKNYLVKLEFAEHVKVVDSALRNFMIENNTTLLKQITSKECYRFFENFKIISGVYNPKMLKIFGIRLSGFYHSGIDISNDTAVVESVGTTFCFLLKGDKWMLYGIGGKYGDSLNLMYLHEQYEVVKRSFRFLYSKYNLFGDKVKVNVSFDDRLNKDKKLYSCLADYNPRAKFKNNELYTYLNKGREISLSKGNVVYVSFTVEKNGSITQVKIHKSFSSKNNNKAIQLIKNMPNWEPGKVYGETVRSSEVVGVLF